ncbi:RnfABCDGE type electron transport complex subunit D [Mucisphaera calidilacus]|uniref:RnfABCDGE type electron transport complex subunit D n=1 Tax=Mucisphaera calidilacus TaxID=2527982 RepID=UPI001F313B92|nr:RnfABCDGE type electron transport complex subunit D [Mucisphaera calidilacus]
MTESTRDARVGGSPWLRTAVTTTHCDVQMLAGLVALVVVACLALGLSALVLVVLCAVGAVAGGVLTRVVVRSWCWTAVLPKSVYLVTLGVTTALLLRPMDGPVRALVAGVLTGVVSVWVGRSSPVRVHPALLGVLLTWSLATAWVPVAPASGDAAVVRAVTSGEAFETQPLGMADASLPTGVWLLEAFDEVAVDPGLYVRGVLDHGTPSVFGALWDTHPSCVGQVSLPVILLVGAWLLGRRLTYWRVPAYGLVAAVLTLLLWPSPGATLMVVESLLATGLRGAAAWTIHVVLATPIVLLLVLIAGSASPISLPGRAVYASLAGLLSVSGMLFTQSVEGAMLGLAAAGLFIRPLDGMRSSPFLRSSRPSA